MPARHTSGKRARRRSKRAALFGPERAIVSTGNGVHRLSCGHDAVVKPMERQNLRRLRCASCGTAGLNRMMEQHSGDGVPYFCEGSGAGAGPVKVAGVAGVLAECRECGAPVLEAPEDPVRVALLSMERAGVLK